MLGLNWQQIVAALEDAEDIALARSALAELELAGGDPVRAGWVHLKDAEAIWGNDDEHVIDREMKQIYVVGVRKRPPYDYDDLDGLMMQIE